MSPEACNPLGNLSEAVYVLATGAGDVRSRLRDAYLPLACIVEEQLPLELREDFKWVMERLTNRKARNQWEGDLDATLWSIQNRTGVKIAQRIVYIEAKLRAILEANQRPRE